MIIFNEVEKMMIDAEITDLWESKPNHAPFGKMKFVTGAEYHARGLQHEGKFVRGYGAEYVDIDEAGMIANKTIEGVVEPMLIDSDGQLNKGGTPWGRNHLAQSFKDGGGDGDEPKPGCFSHRGPSYDNPFVSRRRIDRLAKKMSRLKYETEILALFSDDVGKVFSWRAIQESFDVKEQCKSAPKDGHVYVMGWDLAKHLDWTVGYVLDVTSEAALPVVYSERYQRMPWDHVIARIKEIGNRYGVAAAAIDATGVGDPIVDQIKDAVPVEPFKFTVDTKASLINNLKSILEEGRLKFDYEENLVDELRYFSYELSTRSQHVIMGTQDEHDDCVIALALAAWAFTGVRVEPKIMMV